MHKIIETNRLILRTWQKSDLQPMSEIHQDAKVMEFVGGPKDKAYTQLYIQTLENHYIEHGYTLYAVELKSNNRLIGFIGLRFADYLENCFTPATEIAWRLSSKNWNQGYAMNFLSASMFEFICDSSRTITHMLFSGVFEIYSNIRFIVPHAGGVIPYLAGRINLYEILMPSLKNKILSFNSLIVRVVFYHHIISLIEVTV